MAKEAKMKDRTSRQPEKDYLAKKLARGPIPLPKEIQELLDRIANLEARWEKAVNLYPDIEKIL